MSLTIQGLLVIIFGVFIDNSELASQLASDVVLLLGILVAWYGRYRAGDIEITGLKK